MRARGTVRIYAHIHLVDTLATFTEAAAATAVTTVDRSVFFFVI
jgi:hypothetical protein